MGKVQNDHLYIRYRSSSMKNKANECKKAYKLVGYFIAKSISSANLGQHPEIQMWRFQFCSSFIFFLSPISITPKLYGVCKYYTYQTTPLLRVIFLFWFGGSIWATAGELQPQNCFQRRFACLVVAHPQTTRDQTSLTIIFAFYFALKTNLVQPKAMLCICIILISATG